MSWAPSPINNLVPGNFDNYEKLLNELNSEYKGVVVMQHSSSTILSASTALLPVKAYPLAAAPSPVPAGIVAASLGVLNIICVVPAAVVKPLLAAIAALAAAAVLATAALTLGKNIVVTLNPDIAGKGQRYLGARYTVAGTYNAGKVTADIVETIGDGQKYYASGFTVS